MRKVILIVDDSEDTRELFQATLEAEGFAVVGAKDGAHALDLLRQFPDKFSLILLDIAMPGMTGLEVLENMSKQGLGTGIPVMLVSAVDNLGQLSVPESVIDTLKKPFFYPELIYKIKHVHRLTPEGHDNSHS
jgi:two-component system, NtrC family, response regulator HydG